MVMDEKGGLCPESWPTFHTFRYHLRDPVVPHRLKRRASLKVPRPLRRRVHAARNVHLLDEDMAKPECSARSSQLRRAGTTTARPTPTPPIATKIARGSCQDALR